MKKKILLKSLLVGTLLISSGITIASLAKKDNFVNAFEFSSEYFITNNVSVSSNKSVPSSTGIKDYRNGILFQSSKSGSTVTLKDNLSGTFTIDMMPYSAATYNSSDYETSSYANSYQDIKTMSLNFKDLENEENSFKLVLNGGANGNNVTVNAHVETNNEKMGVHYFEDSAALGNTKAANANDIYTYLYGTSFSNMAVHNGIYSSGNVKSLKLEFDPVSMCVYGYSYGYRTDVESKILIWDFKQQSIDGSSVHKTLNSMNKYQVSLSFDSIASNKTAKVLVYKINEQKFSNTLINNSAGPTNHANVLPATLNEKYVLPKPTAYDVLEGEISFNGLVQVYDELGNKVELYNQSGSLLTNDNYLENCYFIPSSKGQYKIVYQAMDTNSKYGNSKTYLLDVSSKDDVVFESIEEEKYVTLGTSYTIPQVKATSNGVLYNSTVEVITPSFDSILNPTSLDLSKEGLYTIKYKVSINNQDYEKEVKLYASKESTSLFKVDNSNSITYGTTSISNDISGLVVNASLENASVTYSKELDVSSLTKDNKLVSLLALPSKYSINSNSSLTVKLIDKEDPSNYVQVIATKGNKVDSSLVRAGSSDQKLAGLCTDGTISTSSSNGTEILHSFTGNARYKHLKDQTFDVYFDYLDKKVYTTSGYLVSDLDDPSFYSNTWEGFKGDKFILQVSCSGLNEESTNYLIKEVAGYDVSHSHYIDNVAPILNYDEQDFIKGMVNKAYPLPEIKVNDNNSSAENIKLDVTVKKNDKTYPVVNNTFTPDSIGQYVLTYKYVDGYGNVKEFNKRVAIVDFISNIDISVEDDALSGYVGSEITVPEYFITGGEGKKDVSIVAKGKNSNTTYEVVDMKFTPLVEDEYIVTYKATDRLGFEDETTASIAVLISEKPIMTTPSYIPKVIISGKEVTFADVYAKDYNSASKDVEVELYVKINNQEVKLDSLSYVANIDSLNETATLIYKATSKVTNKTATLEYEIPVVRLYDDNEVLHISQYLLNNGFDNITSYDTYIDLTATKNNASFEFIKSVYAHGFQLSFNIPANANNVSSITLYLTDVNDPNKQVKLDVIKGNPSDTFSYLRINDTDTVTMVGTFFGTTATRLKVSYDNSLYSIKDDSGIDITNIKTYLNGDVFKGFSSEIDFKVVLNDVTGITTFRLFEIGNQIMSNVDDDYTVPSITLNGELDRQAQINEEVTIPSAESYDVLGFKTKLSIRVTDPDGQTIYSSNDGNSTTIKLEKYGTYYVIYNASDERNNPMSYSRTITVLDDEAPVITLNGEIVEEVNLNDKVVLPKFSVTDNITAAENIASGIILEGPDSSFMYLKSYEFTATVKGKYIVRYYAIDEAGNVVYQDYVVEVK